MGLVEVASRMGPMGLVMASYVGLCGILTRLTMSTDHPSTTPTKVALNRAHLWLIAAIIERGNLRGG